MTGTARGHNYRAVFGKQSAEGTPNTTDNTLWEPSIGDGSFLQADNNEQALQYTDTDDMPLGYAIYSVSASGEIVMPSDPWTSAALWKVHLGGSAISGAGPYTHTMTKADAPIFSTWFFKRPDVVGGTDRWERADDVMVTGIELSGGQGKENQLKATLSAKKTTFNVTAPAPTASPAAGAPGDYRISRMGAGKLHSSNNATLDLDLDATPATTQIRNVKSFVIKSEWAGWEWFQTDLPNPSYYTKGLYSAGASVTVLFDSFASYASTFFGTKTISSNQAQSTVVVQGALDFLFPVVDATASRTSQIKLTSQRWMVEPANVNTNADAIEVTLTGKVIKPASGAEAISVITINDKSTTP